MTEVLLQDGGTTASNFYCAVIITAMCNIIQYVIHNILKAHIVTKHRVLSTDKNAPVCVLSFSETLISIPFKGSISLSLD